MFFQEMMNTFGSFNYNARDVVWTSLARIGIRLKNRPDSSASVLTSTPLRATSASG